MVDDFDGDAVGAVVLIGFYEVVLGVGKKDSPRALQLFEGLIAVEVGFAEAPGFFRAWRCDCESGGAVRQVWRR